MVLSLTVNAAEGMMRFQSSITATSCHIQGPAGGSANYVGLHPVSVTALSRNGETAGTTQFTLDLFGGPNCTNGTVAKLWFEWGPSVDPVTGALNNDWPNGTQNVQVALLDKDGKRISLANNSNGENYGETISRGRARLTYYARYEATGTATPGGFVSNIAYSVVYN